MGRRFSKVISTHDGSAWQITCTNTFVYDGWNMVAELTQSQTHTLTNFYTWGLDLSGSPQGAGGIGGLLSVTRNTTPAPQTLLYCFDANGNVMQLVVAEDGSLKSQYHYTPFGNTIPVGDPQQDPNPFRFSTKYFDEEANQYYYGYRYYDPEDGRWRSRDPIGERGGADLYVFVLNQPPNGIDELGFMILKTNEPRYVPFVAPSQPSARDTPLPDESFDMLAWVKAHAKGSLNVGLPDIPVGPLKLTIGLGGSVYQCIRADKVITYGDVSIEADLHFEKRFHGPKYTEKDVKKAGGRNSRVPNPNRPGEDTKIKKLLDKHKYPSVKKLDEQLENIEITSKRLKCCPPVEDDGLYGNATGHYEVFGGIGVYGYHKGSLTYEFGDPLSFKSLERQVEGGVGFGKAGAGVDVGLKGTGGYRGPLD